MKQMQKKMCAHMACRMQVFFGRYLDHILYLRKFSHSWNGNPQSWQSVIISDPLDFTWVTFIKEDQMDRLKDTVKETEGICLFIFSTVAKQSNLNS